MKPRVMISILMLIAWTSVAHSVGSRDSCAEVRRTFAMKRLGPVKMVPSYATTAKNLQICHNSDMSCCNRKMERKFQQTSNSDIVDILNQKISGFKLHLTRFEEEFEAHLTGLIRNSRTDTFKKLNATFYDVTDVHFLNTVIDDLYDGIILAKDELTLDQVNIQLSHSVPKFFRTLFALSMQQQGEVRLTEEGFKCVAAQAGILNYYNVYANLIKDHLTKSLNQTSVLVRSLESGVKSVSVSAQSYIDQECQKALVKMQYCSHCYGLTLIKPCRGLCQNVMRGCLVGVSETDRHWRLYVAALAASVRNMTEEKTDLESVLAEISTQLDTVSKMLIPEYAIYSVKGTCGLSVQRNRRSPKNPPISPDGHEKDTSLKRHRQRQQRRNRRTHLRLKSGSESFHKFKSQRRRLPPPHEMLIGDSPLPIKVAKKKSKEENKETKIAKMEENTLNPEIKDLALKSKLKRFVTLLNFSSNFFLDLPDQLCDSDDDMSLPVSTRGNCWDGTKVSKKYTLPIPHKGLESQYSNPEVKITGIHPDVQHSIRYMRLSGKDLFLNAGKMDHLAIFDDLLPVTTPERSTTSPPPPEHDGRTKRPEGLPCDDEDDCGEVGSAGSGGYVERRKTKLPDISKEIVKSDFLDEDMKSNTPPNPDTDKIESSPDFSKSLSRDIEEIMDSSSVGTAEAESIRKHGKDGNSGEGIIFRQTSWRTLVLAFTFLQVVKRLLL